MLKKIILSGGFLIGISILLILKSYEDNGGTVIKETFVGESISSSEKNETAGLRSNAVDSDISDSDASRKDSDGRTDLKCFVQITGAVTNPGVYELDVDSRVFQIVDMAGGYLENADVSAINGASKISDGMNIYVPCIGEDLGDKDVVDISESLYDNLSEGLSDEDKTSSGNAENDKVNINTAGADELMTLPGIGEIKADAIISYRKENGSFSSIEDIKNISGIKDALFNKIKDLIVV